MADHHRQYYYSGAGGFGAGPQDNAQITCELPYLGMHPSATHRLRPPVLPRAIVPDRLTDEVDGIPRIALPE
ncbi:hypothetical protein CCP4SC76_6900027 [Gammaproteobacteria bacterium]